MSGYHFLFLLTYGFSLPDRREKREARGLLRSKSHTSLLIEEYVSFRKKNKNLESALPPRTSVVRVRKIYIFKKERG